MRIFQISLLTLCLLVPALAKAQEDLPPPMVFGKLLPAQLQMKQYEADTSASAVVLCDYAEARVETPGDQIRLRWHHHRRIKILKKQGFSYGDVSIPFYSHNKMEEFFLDEAMVHLPDGRQVKLTKKDIFIEAKNDYVSIARFSFPQLVEGAVIEYAYFINSNNFHELREWYFQGELPVVWSEFRADLPSFLYYIYLFQGNEEMSVVEKTDEFTRYSGKNGTLILSPRRFVIKDAPAMVEEAYVTTMDDYMARIRFQLSEVHYPDGRIEYVMSTWKKLQDELKFASSLGEQLLKKQHTKKMKGLVMPLAANLSTPAEKAQFFYDYLTHQVSWDGNYSLFTHLEKLDDLFASKKANSAELNLMLLALLQEAGITAYPLITSTRGHGRMYEQYPLIDQFNHLLVVAELDGKRLLMDASDPLRPIGYPSVSALNGRGLLLDFEAEPTWIDIVPPKDGADIFVWDLHVSEDGQLKGSLIGGYKGYNAVPERQHYLDDKAGSHWKKRLAERFPDAEVLSVNTANLDKIDKTFSDTVQLNIPTAAITNGGDLIYLEPILYSGFDENLFKLQERTYPVDFPYSFQEQHIIKIHLPAGYQLESTPEKSNIALPANGGSFVFTADLKEPNLLVVSARLSVSRQRLLSADYQGLKKFFELVEEKLHEQVVLKKAG